VNDFASLLKAVVLVTAMGSIFFAAMFFVLYVTPMLVVLAVIYFVYMLIKDEKDSRKS